MQQQNAKSMKYHKMQRSKLSLPVIATNATSGIIDLMEWCFTVDSNSYTRKASFQIKNVLRQYGEAFIIFLYRRVNDWINLPSSVVIKFSKLFQVKGK